MSTGASDAGLFKEKLIPASHRQARGINEGQGARGARDAHALAPREGKPVGFHAVAEEDEGFGADDEAQLFILVQDALGVLDAGIGGGPGLAHKPCE